MNRILNSEGSRLTPAHVDALMKVAIEGTNIPAIQNATGEQVDKYCQFLNRAYKILAKRPRRTL